jgi:hypothetical protein
MAAKAIKENNKNVFLNNLAECDKKTDYLVSLCEKC